MQRVRFEDVFEVLECVAPELADPRPQLAQAFRPVIDSFQFGGPDQIPAKVSYTVEWEATGPAVTLGKGKSVLATDPAAFSGDFAPALARGSFSGRELAFSFKSDPGASSRRGYAEIGRERNGVFL
jgi:hypothetical protein